MTLTAAAPAGGAVVALSSSEWVSFVLPASVTVPAGATSAQFPVTTAIGKATTIITASYNGVNKTATLTSVYPTVTALTCTPNPVIAGNTTVCTVTLNGIMPAATPVWILSDQPFFAPASGTVTVPAGAVSAAFSITTTLVPDQIVAHISANALATATVTAPLTINLTNRGRKWVLNNVVFKDGGTANGYFIYDPATGKYLAVNIRVTPGPDPNNPMGHAPQDLYYLPLAERVQADFRGRLEHGLSDVPAKPGDFRLTFHHRGRCCNSILHSRLRTRAGQFLWSSIPTWPIPRTALITLRRRARRRRPTSLRSASRCPTTSWMSRQPVTTASSSAGL